MAESIITKRSIAESLKSLTKESPFNKISVRDISENAHINRQTFYYHFSDKFILLKWIYDEELFNPNMNGLTLENWMPKFQQLLTTIQNDRAFYSNTMMNTDHYVENLFIAKAIEVFRLTAEDLDVKSQINRPQKDFFAKFFACGLYGILTDWARNDMPGEPAVLVNAMQKLLDSWIFDF